MLYADVEIYYFSRDSARCVHVNDYIALKAKSLPSLSFIIKPGVYSLWSGGGVLLEEEGLYRIIDYKNRRSFQVVVYEYKIWELLSDLCRIFLYGVLDNNLRLDEWTKVATQRHLLMTCNVVATSCFKLLKSLGYKTRVVGLYNSQNVKHGHSLNEVLIDDHYILVDFTKKIFVCDMQGNGVSLRDVIEIGGFSSCQLKPLSWHSLSSDSGMGVEVSANGQVFNSCFASDFYSLAYPLHLKRWFEAFDFFMLSDNPMYEMCILKQEKTARKYCEFSETKYYKFLDADTFFSRFYGEN